MNVCAIVPVKKLSLSKLRLTESLTPHERQDLTLKMLKHVLKVVTKSIKEVLVIGSDEEIKKISKEYGAKFEKDKTSSLNRAIDQAIRKCIKKEHDAILLVAADLPLLSNKDLKQLINSINDESVIICPSKDCGTNTLFLRPPRTIPVHFGINSLEKHLKEAIKKNRKFRLFWSLGFAFDIDVPEDLRLLKILTKKN
ncbi:2-phospho-L-lactate guanylyltransferase [[Eubacterium] cellulosolvens]